MKYLLRAALAVLALVLASVAFCQSQIWSVFQNLHVPTIQDAIKMVKAPDGSFYTLGDAGIFGEGISSEVTHWSPTGQLLWTRQFAGGPLDIDANNAYVVITGTIGFRSTDDVPRDANRGFLLRYDSSGNSSTPVFLSRGGNVAIGANGDAFIATAVPDAVTGSRAAYVEYSPAGNLVRTVTYTGSTSSVGRQIIVNSQSVTLIGSANADRFIAQYNLNGQLNWVHVYNLNDNNGTESRIVDTSDSSGSVYILFLWDNFNTGSGAHIVKYDVAGNLVYDTIPSFSNVSSLAVGPSGQLAVGADALIVYQLAPNGTVQWQTPFASSDAGSGGVAYDASGNVYFVGHIFNVPSLTSNAFIGQINPTGTIQWLKQQQDTVFSTFDGIAVSSSGPVAFGIVGNSEVSGPSLGLHRADASGNFLSATQTQNVYSNQLVTGAAVDTSGNTYLVGSPPFATKFDSNGLVKWTQLVGTKPTAVELYPGGGIVVQDLPAGNTRGPVTVRRVSDAGSVMWQTTLTNIEGPLTIFDHTERSVVPRHTMIEDAAGNTYVIGRKLGQTSHVLAIKLDPSGNVLWTADWNSLITTSSLVSEDLAVSPAGFVYGVLVNNASFNGINTIVLQLNSSTGAINWALPSSQFFDGTEPIAVLTNANGDAFVLGEKLFINPGTAFVWKLDSTGATQWKTTIPGMDQTPAMTDMAIDGSGNIFVTGASIANSDAFSVKNFRAVLAKLSPSGTPLFTSFWDDPAGDGTLAQRMTLDADGNAVLAGTTFSNQTGFDLFVLRLSGSSGQPLWPDSGDVFRNGAAIFDSGWGVQDYFAGIGIDANKNIYVGGNSVGPDGLQDIHVVKYNTLATRGSNDDEFVGQTVATTMAAGQTYNVTVSFKNTGSSPWTKATGYRLVAINPFPNSTWGLTSVDLSSADVINPGDTKTFKFSVFAPVTGGTYNFQWRIRSSAGLIGVPSTNVAVDVVKKAHAARFLSESVNTVVHVGQHFFVQVNMKNVGTNTWTAGTGYTLNPVPGQPTWGVSAVPVNGTVLPGQSTSFTFAAVAPLTPGKYTMEWQMYRTVNFFTGFFGDRTPIKTITVVP
jgi:hypothetical protein